MKGGEGGEKREREEKDVSFLENWVDGKKRGEAR